MRVALYARVSTEEQAKSGYSIAAQKRRLQGYAEREGCQVVEIIADEGYSGTTMQRPGLEQLLELAQEKAIDAVLAIRRDRYFRRQYLRLGFDEDLREFGVRLIALNDTGNKIGDAVLEAVSEVEVDTFRDRVKEGKIEKARQGKVVGGHRRSYGFDWRKGLHKGKLTTIGYEVREDEMQTVQRIFSLVASGTGVRTIKDILDGEYIPTPRRGASWSKAFIRRTLIFDDLYKPHSIGELREAGVSEDVLSMLDDSASYGVYYYSGVPVPIPNAGIAPETVSEARRRLSENVSTSKAGDRVWELSGGILRCAECGRAMQASRIKYRNPKQKTHFYYRCQSMTNGKADKCPMRKSVNADRIESEVWDAVRQLVDDKITLLDKMRSHFDARRRELRGPGVNSKKLIRRRTELEQRWLKFQDAFAADAISAADLKAHRIEIDNKREQIEKALERSRNVESELLALEEAEAELEERITSGDETLKDTPPGEERQELYRDFNLRVHVGADAVPRISGVFPMSFEGEPVKVQMHGNGYGTFVEEPVSRLETTSW